MINIRAKAKARVKAKVNNMVVTELAAIGTVRSRALRQLVDNMDRNLQHPKEANMPQRSITRPAPMYQKGKAHSNLDTWVEV